MTAQSQSLFNMVHKATYARLDNDKGFKMVHGAQRSVTGYIGKVGNRPERSLYFTETQGAAGRFSINLTTQPVAALKSPYQVHNWCYPFSGDQITFYDAALTELGSWNGTQLITPDQNQQKYVKVISKVNNDHTNREEATRMFKPDTSKAKGGYRALVTFNGVVVWEGDQVYADDLNYKVGDSDEGIPTVGESGYTKAFNAATSAVNQAVEALFVKVKV